MNTADYEAIPSVYKTVTCLICQTCFSVPSIGDEINALKWKKKLYEIAKLDTEYLHLDDNRYSFCNECQKQIHLLEELSINFEHMRQSLKNISTEICISVLRVNINMGNPISDRLTQSFEDWNKDRLFDMLGENKTASSVKHHEASVVIEALQNNQHGNEIASIATSNSVAQICEDVKLPMESAETVLVSNNPVGDVYDNVVFPTTTEHLNTDALVGNYGDILTAALSNVLVPELTDNNIVEESTSYTFFQGFSGGTTAVVEVPYHLDTTSTVSFSTLSDANSQLTELNSSQSGNTTSEIDSKAGSKTYQCKLCTLSYTRKYRLISHINKCHGVIGVPGASVKEVVPIQPRCPHCQKTFAKMYSLRKHEQRVHGVKSFSCDQCQKSFTTNNLLQIHRKRHDGPSFKCPICKRCLFQKKSLRYHVNQHYEKDDVTPIPNCEVCGKEMNSAALIMSHVDAHKDYIYNSEPIIQVKSAKKLPTKPIDKKPVENFACDSCKNVYQDKKLLQIHMKIHEKIESFLCEECGECFPTQQHLYSHQQTHIPKQFKCDVCQKIFKKKWNLTNHKATHSDIVYNCQECNHAFKHKSSLSIHMKKHSGIPKFKCTICMDGFSYQMGLRKHLFQSHPQVYMETKKLACEVCYKVFAKQREFGKHKALHAKHKCKLCNRQFKMLQHLNEHMLRHADVRLFKCPCCEKSFVRNQELVEHVKKRHPDHHQEKVETDNSVTYVVTLDTS